MRMVVVLPEPLGPRKPKIVPRLTCIDRSRTTTRPPNDLVRPFTSMTTSRAASGAIAAGRAHRDACGGGTGAGAAVLRGNSVTSTGWPTRSSPGFSGSASIRKTSLERSSRL